MRLFSMVVIGGLSTIPGAVLGAAYVRGAEFFLPAQWTLIASGVGHPPAAPAPARGPGRRPLPRARRRAPAGRAAPRPAVPSLVADRRVDDDGQTADAPTPPGRPTARPSRAGGGVTDRPSCRSTGIDVAYGQTQVLFGVDLEVAEGEIVALLGTNGAGKSTVLRAVSGLTPPTRGRIRFAGQDITGADAGSDLAARHHPGARRAAASSRSLTVRRQPAGGRLGPAQGPGRAPASASERVPGLVPRARAAAGTCRRATCRAASSRCSACPRRSWPGPGC